MKLVLAILRIATMQETKVALQDAGLPSFTVMPVLGRGQGHGDLEKANDYDPSMRSFISDMPRLKSKRMITMVVTDENKDLAVETLIKTNHTGSSGDGKIFVIDTVDSVQIRTGETGDKTLD